MQPRTILLFGRTGEGKSTICTMLYQKSISPEESSAFAVGHGAKGHTIECTKAASIDRLWQIYDTVGLGEPVDGTIPDEEASKLLVKLLKNTNVGIHYVCIVKRRGRLDFVDERIMQVIRRLYTLADLETNAFLIISNCEDTEWLDREVNSTSLTKHYGIQRDHMINVDFPPKSNDIVIERANCIIRNTSLDRLNGILIDNFGNIDPIYSVKHGKNMDREYESMAKDVLDILKMSWNEIKGTVRGSMWFCCGCDCNC